MLWTIVIILIVLWILGVNLHIGGNLIHGLLFIALFVSILRLLS